MKKQLFLLLLCVSHYLFSMDRDVCVFNADCAQAILNYCDVISFERFTTTCKAFSQLGSSMIKDEQEKKRIGSLAWYYSLPQKRPQDRFRAYTNLLNFYRLEYHGSYDLGKKEDEPYKHPHDLLLAQEFYAIWKLHKQEREKTDFHGGLIENYTRLHFGFTPLKNIFTQFICTRNDPAVKILLTRSETLKKQLAENQEVIASQFKSKSEYDCGEILLDDVCKISKANATIMNFLPQDEEGNIEYRHFVYVLSQAIFYRNKKLITFLVNKEPNQIEKAREELFIETTRDSQPSSWQVAEYLFLQNYEKIDQDQDQSVRTVCSLAIDKNKAYIIVYMIHLKGVSFIDNKLFLKILDLPADESINIFNDLLFRKIKFYDIEWDKILKKVRSAGFNDDNKKSLLDIMNKIIAMYTITVHDCDHISRLFDKDMFRNKIGTYIKYAGCFSFAVIASYFLFLKFHGHLHNGFSPITNA